MIQTSELDMADSVAPNDVDVVLTNASWAIRSTNHTVLKASPGVAVFGRDMLFDIPFIADWRKIGYYRQCQTDLNNLRENEKRIDYGKMVFSAKQSLGGLTNHGPLSQFILMEQSGLNAETI